MGNAVALTLSYRLPEGATLSADPEIKGLENLTVLERHISRGRITIKLLVDRLDSWQIGPLMLTFQDKEGKTQTLRADPVSLRVLSNLAAKPEQSDLRPIQGIIPTKPLWLRYLPWAAGLLVILLIGMAVFVWHQRRRSRKEFRQQQEPPHIRARRALEQLEKDGLFERGHVKEFYFRFSEIMRRYLEYLRGFPAAEFTTEEIAPYLDTVRDRKILPLLRQADLIKFADAVPTPAKKDEDLKTAFLYIEENSPTAENGNSSNEVRMPALNRGTVRLETGDLTRSQAIGKDGASQSKVTPSVDKKNQRKAAGPKKAWRDG